MPSIKIIINKIVKNNVCLIMVVPEQGFEPQFSLPESDVLPLDDSGIYFYVLNIIYLKAKNFHTRLK